MRHSQMPWAVPSCFPMALLAAAAAAVAGVASCGGNEPPPPDPCVAIWDLATPLPGLLPSGACSSASSVSEPRVQAQDDSTTSPPACDQIFCPLYSLALSPDPLLRARNDSAPEVYMAVGLGGC